MKRVSDAEVTTAVTGATRDEFALFENVFDGRLGFVPIMPVPAGLAVGTVAEPL